MDASIFASMGISQNIKNRMVKSVASVEVPHYEASHLALHCLHRFALQGEKGLSYSPC